MGPSFRIVFEEDGYPRELITGSEREKAIRDEILTPEMDVTVYRDNQPPAVVKAKEIAELSSLFNATRFSEDTAAAPEPAPVSRKRKEPADRKPNEDLTSSQRTGINSVMVAPGNEPDPRLTERIFEADTENSEKHENAETKLYEEDDFPIRSAYQPSNTAGLWVLIGFVAVILTIGTCAINVDSDPAANTTEMNVADDQSPTNEGNTEAQPEPDEVTADEIGQSQWITLSRDEEVRASSDLSSPVVGLLKNGSAVQGVTVSTLAGQDWIKITIGKYAGYFFLSNAPSDDGESSEGDESSAVSNTALDEPIGTNSDSEPTSENPVAPATPVQLAPVTAPRSAPGTPVQSRPVRLISLGLTPGDYPPAAAERGETGLVGFSATVGTNGRVIACRIIRSSGFAQLDNATCSTVQRRAVFDPELDSQGSPVLGTYEGRINWKLD